MISVNINLVHIYTYCYYCLHWKCLCGGLYTKPFFLYIILTYVTEGLIILYACDCLFQGVWMCVSPRNLLIQASLTMVMMPSWCGTTLILIIRFRSLSIVFLWMVHLSEWWLMTVVVSKNILKFHFLTKEE